MYRFSANSRATMSSTAIFLSQQSRQYFSSPRGSETSFALQSAQRTCATDFRGIVQLYQVRSAKRAIRGRQPLSPDARLAAQGGRIHDVDVVLDHPPRAEAGRHGDDRVADELQPASRDPVVAVV